MLRTLTTLNLARASDFSSDEAAIALGIMLSKAHKLKNLDISD